MAQALLWLDSEPADVRRALRKALSLLRSLLGEAAISLRGKGACHAGGGTLVL
jgi:DNA-binding SARP family transcriptional activator